MCLWKSTFKAPNTKSWEIICHGFRKLKKTTREHLKGLEEKDGEITGMECIGPTVLYGSETWTLKKTPNQKFLRCGSGVRWKR